MKINQKGLAFISNPTKKQLIEHEGQLCSAVVHQLPFHRKPRQVFGVITHGVLVAKGIQYEPREINSIRFKNVLK